MDLMKHFLFIAVSLFLEDFLFINFLSDRYFVFVSWRVSCCYFLVSLRYIQKYLFLKFLVLRKAFFFFKPKSNKDLMFFWFTVPFLRTFYMLFHYLLQFNVLYSPSMMTALQCGRITFLLQLLHRYKEILFLNQPFKTLNQTLVWSLFHDRS